MQSQSKPPCRHYFEHKTSIPGLGHDAVEISVPVCWILTSLEAASLKDMRNKLLKLQVLDQMAKKGGGSIETTQCQFAAASLCPYYQP